MLALGATEDHALRCVMVKALNRLHVENPKLVINRTIVKSEISREAALHQKIISLLHYYRGTQRKSKKEDYLGVTLLAIRDESLDRIFHYLNLLYPNEMIQMVFDKIVARPADAPVYAPAADLLAHTVGTDLGILMYLVFAGNYDISFTEYTVVEIFNTFYISVA